MRKHPKAAKAFHSQYSRFHRTLAILIMCVSSIASSVLPVMARGTYVITDGQSVIVHQTFSRNPEQVLYEAGVELSDSDTYTAQRNGDNLELVVNRSQFITVQADGKTHSITTYGETVGEILSRLQIELNESDRISHPLETPTEDGMVITVTRITTKTITYEQVVPAEEQVFLNSVLQPGQETVLEEGADGLSNVTASITYEDGVEIAREIVSEEVVVPSQDHIVIRGAEEAAMPTDAEGNAIVTAGGELLEYSQVIDGKATAYNCPGYVGHTASGTVAEVGKVAVDPKVIPLGTKLYIVSQDGQYVYGYCIAEDTGGLIKGNKVDLYFSTWDECIQFGYRPVTIYVVAE